MDRAHKLTWLVALPGALLVLAIIVVCNGPRWSASPDHRPARRDDGGDALRNLRSIHRGIRAHHLAEGTLPEPVAPPTPARGSCCDQPRDTCAPDATLWEVEPWPSIGFDVYADDAYSYSYAARPGGLGFEIRAEADPDCDGTFTVLEIHGEVVNGEIDANPRVERYDADE